MLSGVCLRLVWLSLLIPCATGQGGEGDADERIQQLFRDKKYREVIAALDAHSPDTKSSRIACFLRGHAHYQLEEFDKALAQFRQSEARGEVVGPFLAFIRGTCAMKMGDFRGALTDFAVYAAASSAEEKDVNRLIADAILVNSGGYDERLRLLRSEMASAGKPWHLLWRGIAEYDAENLKQSESNFTVFLRLQPDCERGWFWRCKVRHALGRDADAVADYAKLLQLNPAHAGGFDEQAARRAIAQPEKLAVGRRQLEQVLKDRPRMGIAFDPANPLHAWVAWRFQQRVNGRPIVWQAGFDDIHAPAYNVYSTKLQAWTIHISDIHRSEGKRGQPQTSDEMWFALLFELENVTNRWLSDRLETLAERGKITEREFVLTKNGIRMAGQPANSGLPHARLLSLGERTKTAAAVRRLVRGRTHFWRSAANVASRR